MGIILHNIINQLEIEVWCISEMTQWIKSACYRIQQPQFNARNYMIEGRELFPRICPLAYDDLWRKRKREGGTEKEGERERERGMSVIKRKLKKWSFKEQFIVVSGYGDRSTKFPHAFGHVGNPAWQLMQTCKFL